MTILDDFECLPPEDNDGQDNGGDESYLTRYYNEALADLLQCDAPSGEELFPYEVLIFSDQPGILRI